MHFRLTKTWPDTLAVILFKSLALNNLHFPTLDYNIWTSLNNQIDTLLHPLPHMATLPHKSCECAYHNVIHTTISTLWQVELLNHAPLHLPYTSCMKDFYIHIARDNLQRRDLFKPTAHTVKVITVHWAACSPHLLLSDSSKARTLFHRSVSGLPAAHTFF